MATRTLEAVYEHGVLRPLTPLHLQEGETVAVTVESKAQPNSDRGLRSLEILTHVLDGLSEEEIAEFERHLKRPMSMFELPSE